jgi:hypothetical protein
VPGLLLTLVIVALGWSRVPTTYQSTATLSLIGSKALAAEPGGGKNPFVVVGDLGPMANILASNLSSQAASERLRALGVAGAFTAEVPTDTTGQLGPFITIAVSEDSASAVARSMPTAIKYAETSLQKLQEDTASAIPNNELIRAVVIAAPSSPAPVRKSKIELLAAIAVVGIVATLFLTFGAEARGQRRREQQTRKAASSMSPPRRAPQGQRVYGEDRSVEPGPERGSDRARIR